MPWVEFLQNHDVDLFHRKAGDTADLRDAHAESLVRKGVCKYTTDPNDAVGISTTDINTIAKLNAIITDRDVIYQDDNWTGTQGSVVFVGANGGLDEDNATLFFDDTNDRLAVNAGTSPEAVIHAEEALDATHDLMLLRRTASEATAFSLFVGPSGTRPDFAVWGDGRVSIGQAETTSNGKLRINVADTDTNIASALFIDNDDTGTITALEIDHEAATGDAIQLSAACTSAQAIDVQADALTSGSIAFLSSNSASTTTRPLVKIVNDNTAAVNAKCLEIRNDAVGILMQLLNLSSAVIHEQATTGHWKQLPIADGTETDVAPADDHTTKKLSIQKLAAPPTNAAYIAFANNPGAETFYLVLEEG